jgi:cytochrome c peroxidase
MIFHKKYSTNILITIFSSIFLFYACAENKKEKKQDPNSIYTALPQKVIHPKNNLSNPDKIKLGKLLFYDPILSGNKDVACVSCHHPNFGYAEPLDLSIGVNGTGLGRKRQFKKNNHIPIVKRNAHTILNTSFNGINIKNQYNPTNAPMFWDSREKNLEDQALGPIKSLEEMKGDLFAEEEILDTIINRLKNIPEYVKLFDKAFPLEKEITSVALAKSIACFERTLNTNNSRFDKFMRGDSEALSTGEKEGFELFKKAKCNNCHSGPMFSDYKMHVLGIPDNEKLPFSDSGFEETYGFRTPTLRNLRFTAPYMHNGKLKTLLQVLEFYEDIASGNSKNPKVSNHQLDSLTKDINIKVKDMSSIISFFNTLNDENFDKSIPLNVPSNLPVGGNIH